MMYNKSNRAPILQHTKIGPDAARAVISAAGRQRLPGQTRDRLLCVERAGDESTEGFRRLFRYVFTHTLQAF